MYFLTALKTLLAFELSWETFLTQPESFINVSSYEWRQIVTSASLAQPLAWRLSSRNPDNIHLQ